MMREYDNGGVIMLNFVLCDDNQQHNTYMQQRVEKILEKNNFIGKVALVSTNPFDIQKYVLENSCENNVYMLDIDLNNKISGIELAKSIREYDSRSYLIFVTAHQEYTLVSFKIKTFDFLVKPISLTILESTIKALYKDYTACSEQKSSNFLSVKSGTNIHIFNLNDIVFFEKFGQVMVIHTLNGIVRCYLTLESVQEKIEGNQFYRCHKSYLINKKYISNIDIKKNIVTMYNREECPISRLYKKELLRDANCIV